MNRREFIAVSAAAPLAAYLPHKHRWTTHVNTDAYKCACGEVKTGLEMFLEQVHELPT